MTFLAPFLGREDVSWDHKTEVQTGNRNSAIRAEYSQFAESVSGRVYELEKQKKNQNVCPGCPTTYESVQ